MRGGLLRRRAATRVAKDRVQRTIDGPANSAAYYEHVAHVQRTDAEANVSDPSELNALSPRTLSEFELAEMRDRIREEFARTSGQREEKKRKETEEEGEILTAFDRDR
jgi:hypothetical protein